MKKGGKGKASRKKQENKGGDWNPGPQPHPPTTGGNTSFESDLFSIKSKFV